jgi:hypothetical protein
MASGHGGRADAGANCSVMPGSRARLQQPHEIIVELQSRSDSGTMDSPFI